MNSIFPGFELNVPANMIECIYHCTYAQLFSPVKEYLIAEMLE